MYAQYHTLTRMAWHRGKRPVADQITLRMGAPDALRPQMAALYYQTFQQKLGTVFESWERALDLLEQALALDLAIVAQHQQRVMGFAGLAYGPRRFVDLTPTMLVREFGLLRGLGEFARLAALDSAPRRDEVLVESLAVRPEMRGQGIGSRLLDAVCAFARKNGFASVGLEVVDTNPGARRLYERVGFVPVKTRTCSLLGRAMDFGSVIKMEKHKLEQGGM